MRVLVSHLTIEVPIVPSSKIVSPDSKVLSTIPEIATFRLLVPIASNSWQLAMLFLLSDSISFLKCKAIDLRVRALGWDAKF
eukprot:766265-Hanusia_phi.AAC.1